MGNSVASRGLLDLKREGSVGPMSVHKGRKDWESMHLCTTFLHCTLYLAKIWSQRIAHVYDDISAPF